MSQMHKAFEFRVKRTRTHSYYSAANAIGFSGINSTRRSINSLQSCLMSILLVGILPYSFDANQS